MTHRMLVYLITNLINGKHYVGKTVQLLKKRWAGHLSDVRRGSQTHLHSAIRKYGREAFSIIPLVTILASDPQLKELEKFWIHLLNVNDPRYGYNETLGGDGALGCSPSVETRRRLSAAHTGISFPVERCRHISEALKGRVRSAEHCRHIGEALRGHRHAKRKTLSAEHRRKIGDIKKGNKYRKGKPHSTETRRRISDAFFLKTVAWG